MTFNEFLLSVVFFFTWIILVFGIFNPATKTDAVILCLFFGTLNALAVFIFVAF